MVAVVTSDNLGLFNSSLSLLGAGSSHDDASLGQAASGVYVNAVSGNLVVQSRQQGIDGIGVDFAQSRTYNSFGQLQDDNQDGWRYGYSRELIISTNTIQRLTADGATQTFDKQADGSFLSADGAGAHDVIRLVAGQYEYTEGSSQIKETYNADGQLQSILDREGKGLHFSYGSDGYLQQLRIDIEGGQNRIDFNYKAALTSSLKLLENYTLYQQVDGQEKATRQKTIQYLYDSADRMERVNIDITPDDLTDNKVYQTTYEYQSPTSHLLKSIKNNDGTSTSFTFYADGKVDTVTDGEGNITKFVYNEAANKTDVTVGGTTFSYEYDANNRLRFYRGEVILGQQVSAEYRYDDATGDLLTVIDGENRAINFVYDDNGNKIREYDALGNTVRFFYNDNNQLIQQTRYLSADVNTQDELFPADALHSYFVYDSNNQLRYSLSAEGRVSYFEYNGLGQQIKQVVFREDFSVDATPTLAELNSFRDSIAAQSRDTDLSITDLTYSVLGQLETQTNYQNNTGLSGSGQTATTHFQYDVYGNLLSKIAPEGVASLNDGDHSTHFVYDGLGRLLQSSDARGVQTFYQYQDATQQLVITSASGLVTSSTFDNNRNLIAVEQGTAADLDLYGVIENRYDPKGRLVATQDLQDAWSYIIRDGLGRERFVIDSVGRVSENRYDQSGKLKTSIVYANKVNTQSWLGNGPFDTASDFSTFITAADTKLASNGDRANQFYYDILGRQQFVVDALGYVSELRYDTESRVVATLGYSEPNVLNNGSIVANSDFRLSRSFYSGDGLVLATMDGEGYVTEFIYDASGRQTGAIAHSQLASNIVDLDLETASLNSLIPATDLNALHSASFYDGRGLLRANVGSDGAVIEFNYDLNGQLVEQYQYATRIVGFKVDSALTLPAKIATDDQITRFTYTERGELSTQTAANGSVTEFIYNEAGQLVYQKQGSGIEAREQYFQYDERGLLTSSLDGNQSNQISSQAVLNSYFNTEGARNDYDSFGRLVKTTGRDDSVSYLYYNADNQISLSVQVLTIGGVSRGEVTEFSYNDFGELEATRVIAERLNLSTLALTGGDISTTLQNAIDVIRSSAAANLDSVTENQYTKRGRIDFSVGADGSQTDFSYNAFGQLATSSSWITDQTDIRTDQFGYDKRGLLTTTTADLNGLNIINSTEFDAFGRVVAEIDGEGNRVSFDYKLDANQRVIKRNGDTLATETLDAFGRVHTRMDTFGNETTTTFDETARSLTVLTPEGLTSTTFLNEFGEVDSVVIDGVNTRHEYDHNGNRLKSFVDNVLINEQQYDVNNQVVLTIDGEGREVAFKRDELGRLVQEIISPDGLNLQTRFEYNTLGLVTQVTDAEDRVVTSQYDLSGRLTDSIQTVSLTGGGTQTIQTHFEYDAAGRQVSISNGFGSDHEIKTAFVYDHLGRVTQQIQDPDGTPLITYNGYDQNGNLLRQQDAENNVSFFVYDDANRLQFQLSATGSLTENHYDLNGNLTAKTRYSVAMTNVNASLEQADETAVKDHAIAHASTALTSYFIYDDDNRLQFSLDATGAITESRYNDKGLAVEAVRYAQIDNTIALKTTQLLAGNLSDTLVQGIKNRASANDQHTFTVYDNQNRARFSLQKLRVAVAGGFENRAIVKESRFDNSGALIETIAYHQSIVFNATLDEAGIEQALQNAGAFGANNNRSTQMFYDEAGRLRFTLDSEGGITETRYNAAGQVEESIAFEKGIDELVGLSLSGLNYQTLADFFPNNMLVAGDRTTTTVYDAAGRVSSITDAKNQTESFSYYANGLKSSYTNQKGKTWFYRYDDSGRLSQEFTPEIIQYEW